MFSPQDTMPAKKNLLLYSQANGPPESPAHASTPPCNNPIGIETQTEK